MNSCLLLDESMVMLFNEGCGRVVTDAIHWLTQSDDKLIAAGSLAIGNCARNGKLHRNYKNTIAFDISDMQVHQM